MLTFFDPQNTSPYRHISYSGFPVHLKINKNFVLDIQYIFLNLICPRLLIYASPYTHISPTVFFGCSSFLKKYLTEKNGCFLTNIKSSISAFCLLRGYPLFHIVTFDVPKNSVHVNNSQSQKTLKY